MQAGKLRDRITVQRVSDNPIADAETGQIDLNDERNWNTLGSRWAEVKSQTGTEGLVGPGKAGVRRKQVLVRYDELTGSLTTRDRLIWRGQRCEIEDIDDPDGRRRGLLISCRIHSDLPSTT